jgi:putative transcriptional regulator
MREILDIAHDMARDLLKAGAMDEITMRQNKALRLPPKRAFRPEDIRRIRMANHVSQAVFAAILGIGKITVQQWEQGQRRPSGPAQRLLDLIDRKGLAGPLTSAPVVCRLPVSFWPCRVSAAL